MLFIVDLTSMLTGLSPTKDGGPGVTFLRLAVSAIAFSTSFAGVLALPAIPLPQNLLPVQVNTSSLLAPPYPRPPQEPACPSTATWGATLGRPSYTHCDYILSNLYPKDPLAKPVMRNFYTASKDVSDLLPNFRLPYEQSYSIIAPKWPKRLNNDLY